MQQIQRALNQPVNPFSHLSPEQQDAVKKAVNELKVKLDQAVLAVFNSAEGMHLLDMWDDYYIRQPVIMLGATELENHMREGRNTFIRALRETVNRANKAE